MLHKLILSRLDKEEARLGESLDYLRHILKASTRAFFRFAKIMPISTYREVLPVSAFYVGRLVATRDEDCGTCVQIELNLAQQEGVSKEVLRAVVDRAPDRLDEELADTYRFAEAVVEPSASADKLRPRIVSHFGERGLVELAMAIGSSRFFPIVKRSLGYSTSCSQVPLRLQ
ncbi:MAG: hypothetical protein ACE5GX_13435 [Thermoanaerobaculia bacterium]